MKLKKLLVMSMAALSILMVGCQKDVGSSNTASTSSQVVLESMDNNINYETVPVPEGGWTVEELAKTIRINGKPVEIPFTVESLGEDYQLDDNSSSWDENKKTLTSSLLYKGDPFMTVYISNIQSSNLNAAKSLEVVRLGVLNSDNIDLNEITIINGIHIGSTDEYVKAVLGEPSEVDGNNLIYKDKNNKRNIAIFWIDENSNVRNIFLLFKDE